MWHGAISPFLQEGRVVHRFVDAPGPPFGGPQSTLTGQQKAAIIVRVLLADGPGISLLDLSGGQQADLVHQMADMTQIDHATKIAVVEEFLAEFTDTGLAFPGALEESLALMADSVSPETARRIRREAGLSLHSDPWEQISALDVEDLLPLFEKETIEVGAVILSKLKVAIAAELLGMMAGERARRITYAVSLTSEISPKIVRAIGQAITAQFDTHTDLEFADGPVERVGAILNFSPAAARDDMLEGLQKVDAGVCQSGAQGNLHFRQHPGTAQPARRAENHPRYRPGRSSHGIGGRANVGSGRS